MRRSIPLVILFVLCLSMLFFLPGSGPQPALAYVSNYGGITGETAYVPYRGPDAVWYHQTFTYPLTVVTFDISTACPDIDAYMIMYEDATAMIVPDVLATDLGTVTANQIAVERNVADTSNTQKVSMTLIDYVWDD